MKATILRDVDDQFKKLCKKSDEKSSVLRVPRSKHKVNYSFVRIPFTSKNGSLWFNTVLQLNPLQVNS